MILWNVVRDIYKPYQYMSPMLIKHQKKTILLLTKGILNSNICQMIFFLAQAETSQILIFKQVQIINRHKTNECSCGMSWDHLTSVSSFYFFHLKLFFWTIPVIWSSLPSLNTNNTQWGIEHQIDAFLRHINQTRM